MGAVTGTKTFLTEFAGKYKILHITTTLASASDTITLTEADHGITTISGIMGAVIMNGMDADFSALEVTYSGLVITVVSTQPDGAASDEWTDADIAITLIGY